MACFDLQHQYLVQPLFVDSSLAASRYSIAATQVLCSNNCGHQSKSKVSFVKMFFGFVFFLDAIRSCAFRGWGWNGPKCIALLLVRITEACLEIGFSLAALIGWCGRLSVHDSSFSVHGSNRGWSFLMVTRHTAIDTLIPCTIQKFLPTWRISAVRVVSTASLLVF